MKNYQLPLYERFQPHFWQRLAWIAVMLSATVTIAMTLFVWDEHEQVVETAQARINKAEADREEVLQVLSGKLAMISPIEGNLVSMATVTWQPVREVTK